MFYIYMYMKYRQFFPLYLNENRKLAKQYVEQGKLSAEDFNLLVGFDPSSTKKYVGWLAKQWINKETSGITTPDDLRNTIEEYDVFVKNGKTKTKDVFQFKTFKDLKMKLILNLFIKSNKMFKTLWIFGLKLAVKI